MPREKRLSLHGGGETNKTGDTTGAFAIFLTNDKYLRQGYGYYGYWAFDVIIINYNRPRRYVAVYSE